MSEKAPVTEDKKKGKKGKKGQESEHSDSSTKGAGKKIRFRPTLSECGKFFQDCLEKIRTSTNQFLRLEKDLVTFLQIDGEPSFELPGSFVWLQDASNQLQDIFNANIIEPNKLLDEYKKYEDIINIDKKKMIAGLFKREPTEENPNKKAPHDEIHEALERFHVAEYEILNISNDTVDFPIFRV